MNEAILACKFLKVEGSYMWVFTVLGAIILALIITNEAILACTVLKVEGSCMQGFNVLEAIVLVLIITNETISVCRFLKVEGSYIHNLTVSYNPCKHTYYVAELTCLQFLLNN